MVALISLISQACEEGIIIITRHHVLTANWLLEKDTTDLVCHRVHAISQRTPTSFVSSRRIIKHEAIVGRPRPTFTVGL